MFDWVPNPMDWMGGEDRASVPQGPDRWAASQQGNGPEPASIRDRYRARAFHQVGADDEASFQSMDPRQRNTRITGAYADMYMSDTDTMKWAGMAAYASDLVGVGIAGTQAAGAIPLLPEGMDTAGIDNAELQRLLAVGNAGVYDDLMWQHMAMQEGGIEQMRLAHEAGEIPDEQIAGWETIAAGRAALDEARASGDERAIEAANNQVWAGNNQLLQYEQQVFLQNLVYDDSPAARELFSRITPGMISPVPGGTSFINHNDANGGPTGSGADVGDVDQRWSWIRDTMAPEYRAREEGDHDSMLRDMRRFSANADTGLPGLPVNSEDPLDFQLPSMPDIPYLPMIQREAGQLVDGAVDWFAGTRVGGDLLAAGNRVGSDLSAAGNRVYNDASRVLSPVVDAAGEMISPVIDAGADLAGRAWNATTDAASSAWGAVSPYANAAGNAISNVAGQAWDATTNAAGAVVDAAAPYANRAAQAAGSVWDWGTGVASDAWNTVSGAAAPVIDAGVETAGRAWDATTETANQAWNVAAPVVDQGVSLAGRAVDHVVDAATPVVNAGARMAGRAWDATTNAAGRVADAAAPIVNAGVETAGRAWDATTSAASTAWNAAAPVVDRAYTATTGAISTGYNAATGAVSSAYNWLTDW
ncbi:MAG: hypothetical protein AB7T06_30980 [Kofleriaceae bacterium]